MTKQKKHKSRVRARQAATGKRYTEVLNPSPYDEDRARDVQSAIALLDYRTDPPDAPKHVVERIESVQFRIQRPYSEPKVVGNFLVTDDRIASNVTTFDSGTPLTRLAEAIRDLDEEMGGGCHVLASVQVANVLGVVQINVPWREVYVVKPNTDLTPDTVKRIRLGAKWGGIERARRRMPVKGEPGFRIEDINEILPFTEEGFLNVDKDQLKARQARAKQETEQAYKAQFTEGVVRPLPECISEKVEWNDGFPIKLTNRRPVPAIRVEQVYDEDAFNPNGSDEYLTDHLAFFTGFPPVDPDGYDFDERTAKALRSALEMRGGGVMETEQWFKLYRPDITPERRQKIIEDSGMAEMNLEPIEDLWEEKKKTYPVPKS